MKKTRSFLSTGKWIVRFYLQNAPFKMIWEFLLDAAGKIMTVVTSVWLLERLTGLILAEAAFREMLIPLAVVTAINILLCVISKFYFNLVKPQGDIRLEKKFNEILLDHAKKLPLCCYENSEFYTTVDRAQSSYSAVSSAYADLIQIGGNLSALIAAIGVVARISPFLLLFLGFTLPMIAVSKKIGTLAAEKGLKMTFFGRKKQYANQVLLSKNYAREFKISDAISIPDKHYEEGYLGAQEVNGTYGKKLFKWGMLASGFSVTYITLVSYLYGIVAYVYFHAIDLSGFSVIFVAIMNMVSKMRKIYQLYERVCGYRVRLEPFWDFLKMEPEDQVPNGLVPGEFDSLEFRGVRFSYDKKNDVLKNLSFKIHKGEKISIVGYNGAGKSTIIKLILRFYDPDQGEILYNGVNIKEYRLDDYRKIFGAAFQDFQIFSLSLAENILLHEYREGEARGIADILREIRLGELVGQEKRRMGREYDQDGLVLSGGQMQKVAVARLSFKEFDVALLDEPSAALDPISSDQMLSYLLGLTQNRKTMIMISHDMSFSKSADRIFFIENGILEESGSHETLMRDDRKYAEFFRYQSSAFQTKSEAEEALL